MTDKDEEPPSLTPDRGTDPSVHSHSMQSNSNQNLIQPLQLSPEQQLAKVKRELEAMVIRYAKSESENLLNKAKSEELDKRLKRAIKDNDSLANRIKILTNDKIQLTDTLNAKLAHLTVLEQKNRLLSSTQSGKLQELETEVELLKQKNEELLKQIDTYKCKEGELLDFSERLSMKLVLLQTELDKALECTPDYKAQYEQLVKENSDLSCQMQETRKLYDLSQGVLEEERELNARLRQECNQLEMYRKRSVEELENEIKVLRRRHQMATKELLKQLKGFNDKVNPLTTNKVTS